MVQTQTPVLLADKVGEISILLGKISQFCSLAVEEIKRKCTETLEALTELRNFYQEYRDFFKDLPSDMAATAKRNFSFLIMKFGEFRENPTRQIRQEISNLISQVIGFLATYSYRYNLRFN